MDPNRLKQGEQIAAGSAVVLFIVMFFNWFGAGPFSANAWESFEYITSILAITIFTTLLAVGFRAAGKSLGELPGSVVIVLLGGLSTLLVLYRLLDPIEGADRKFGLFLGLIAVAGIAVGGYLAMQEEGTSFDDVANQFGGGGGYQDPGHQGGYQEPAQPAPPAQQPPAQQQPPPPPPPPAQGGGAPPAQ